MRTWYTVGGQATPVSFLFFFSSLANTHAQTHTCSFSDRLSSYSVGNARNFCVSIGKKSPFPSYSPSTNALLFIRSLIEKLFELYCHIFPSVAVPTLTLFTRNNLIDHIILGIMCASFSLDAELTAHNLHHH